MNANEVLVCHNADDIMDKVFNICYGGRDEAESYFSEEYEVTLDEVTPEWLDENVYHDGDSEDGFTLLKVNGADVEGY